MSCGRFSILDQSSKKQNDTYYESNSVTKKTKTYKINPNSTINKRGRSESVSKRSDSKNSVRFAVSTGDFVKPIDGFKPA